MANMTPSMRHQPFANGTLTDSNPVFVSMADAPLPATLVLNSAAAGRSIQILLLGGQYFTPVYDQNTVNQLAVSIGSGITSVAFTGQAGDTWGVI